MPALGSIALHVVPPGTVVGLPALVVNLIVTVAVSLLTRPPSDTAIDVGIGDNSPPAPEPVTTASLTP